MTGHHFGQAMHRSHHVHQTHGSPSLRPNGHIGVSQIGAWNKWTCCVANWSGEVRWHFQNVILRLWDFCPFFDCNHVQRDCGQRSYWEAKFEYVLVVKIHWIQPEGLLWITIQEISGVNYFWTNRTLGRQKSTALFSIFTTNPRSGFQIARR